MGKKFIVSAFGKDRPGIVADVSQILYENGCNLEDSRMTNLSGEFSLLILFSSTNGGDDLEPRLSVAFDKLEQEKGISSYIRPVEAFAKPSVENKTCFTLTVEGLDHTGIVHRVSRHLADRAVNIANLDSTINYAPQSGAAIYSMSIEIEIPNGLSMDDFKSGLDRISEQLHVDISISEAH